MTNPSVLFSLLVRGERDTAPLDRAELSGDEYRWPCPVCNRTTVWQVINVAGRLTVICMEHEERQ